MSLRKWKDMPDSMRVKEVRQYYEVLRHRQCSLFLKRIFDIITSVVMLLILSLVFLFLAVCIKADSKGPVFYRQVRVTQYGRTFRIHKFRTMVDMANSKGTLVTVDNDVRITRVGRLIRKKRLDEIPQLLDVLRGDMTFVGVRPEVPKYVEQYTPEMMATLLLPAGITNMASVYYQDEAMLLRRAEDPDETYINEILPEKMKWNLKGLKEFGFMEDIRIMFKTFFSMCGKRYEAMR